MGTSVRTDVAAEALTEIITLLALETPLTAEEIADARAQLIGLAPLQYETAGAVVGQSSRLAAVGLGVAEVNHHFDLVSRVTPEQASAAFIAQVCEPGGHIVMVGDAESLVDPLTEAGYRVEVTELLGQD